MAFTKVLPSGISSSFNLTVDSINSVGVVTATSIVATTGTFSGNVSVAGTLTYEDVTNIDSIGIITARSTIDAQGNVTVGAGLSVVGVSTLGNTVVGGATTELVVTGDARITGILTIGTASITIDGSTGKIDGASLSNSQISAIESTISDTAVDIFVYDTRKDSDGGAWRKRTQHTSWYNETLNTATRGARREFPAVAVIVLEYNGVMAIYDGDDPDMPMWIKFVGTGVSSWNQGVLPTFNGYTAINALNGIIAVATTNQSFGFIKINFISDNTYNHTNSGNYGGQDILPLSQRNSSGHTFFSGSGSLPSSSLIFNNNINDVAMTVLPNAPIDPSTGLPIPTIAVATDGGVSVIKDDGTVVDLTYYSTNAISRFIHISEEGKIRYGSRSYSSIDNFYIAVYNNIPSSDISSAPDSLYTYGNSGGGGNGYYYLTTQRNGTTTPIRDCIDLGNQEFAASTVDYSGAGAYGIHKVVELPSFNSSSVPEPLVAIATTSFNTGWMHGDIKGAFLSDTDDTNVTGTELVTNGTFDTNTTGWTLSAGSQGGTITVNGSNQLVITQGSNSAVMYATQFVTTVVGKTYVASVTVVSTTEANYFRMWIGTSANTSNLGTTGTLTTAGTYNITFTATSTTSYITLNSDQNASRVTIWDNVSARLAEEDRSVNNKGLQVFGTIAKSAVATGADLVAYGPFTDSNYLRQPYNSGLNFGTGAFSSCFWIKPNANTPYMRILNRVIDVNNKRWEFYTDDNSDNIVFYMRDSSNASYIEVNNAIPLNIWTHIYGVRETNGDLKIYVNGVLGGTSTIGSGNNPAIRDLTSSTANLLIGNAVDWDADNAFNGQLSLLKISQSVPSPTQIAKIYNDEKVLFQENAKCTLYGSSDAVTALAYDSDTNLLYAGTSSGRSDFQGLRRINNTTTAVTTAISASNGLIAEQ